MDITKEFRRLAGLGDHGAAASLSQPEAPCGGFMAAAAAQQRRLQQLRQDAFLESAEASTIQVCQEEMSELERRVADVSDLGDRAPRQRRDLLAHRQALVAGLYEELRVVASQVQSSQFNDMQREAEVASFFTASPLTGEAVPAIPAVPAVLSKQSVPECNHGLAEEALRNEEQQLLTTFRSDLDHVQATQSKIEEVASLVGLFATKVVEQQEQLDDIHTHAEEATSHVERAEGHLKRAVENSNAYRFYVVCWFVGSALALLIIDFIDERYSFI